MDICREVQSRLDLAPASQSIAGADESHLRNCPTCQAVVAQRRKFDASIRSSLQDVAVPTDLRKRLLEAMTSASVGHPQGADSRSTRAHSWRTWSVAVTLLLLVGVGTLFLLVPSPPERFVFADLQPLLQQQFAQPAEWSTLPPATGLATSDVERELGRLRLSAPHGINLDQAPGADAALFSFRHQKWTGVIIAIPNDRLLGGPASTTPQLRSQQRNFAWQSRNGQWTYVCYVHSGPPAGLMQSLFGGLA